VFLSDNGANPWYSADYPGATEPDFASQFDNSLENIGRPRSNYAYGIGFASGSGGPLDKFKMTVGEGGIRVPLLISGPGVKGGRRIESFAYVTDVMPTLLELTGVKYPSTFQGRKIEPMRGRSLVKVLNGSTAAAYGPDEYVGGEMGGGKWMRQGDLKAVFVPKPYGTGEWQLAVNLAKKMPERLESLVAAWDRYADEVGVVPP
jgi:arylsulfatase